MATTLVFCVGTKKNFEGELYKGHCLGVMFFKWLAKEVGASVIVDGNVAYFEHAGMLYATNLTSANSCGDALKRLLALKTLEGFEFAPASVLIVHDDMDIEKGKLKLSTGAASAAGNKPIQSLLSVLYSNMAARLKIGAVVTNLDQVLTTIDVQLMLELMPKVNATLVLWLRECNAALTEQSRMWEFTATAQKLLSSYPAQLQSTLSWLNAHDRAIRQNFPPAIAVLSDAARLKIEKATRIFYQAAQAVRGNPAHFLDFCKWYGVLNAFGADDLRAFLRFPLEASYLNCDFHAASPTSSVTMLEANSTLGALHDAAAFAHCMQDSGVVFAPVTGLHSLIAHAIKPRVKTGVVAIVNFAFNAHVGDDGHAELLHELLLQDGVDAKLCALEQLEISNACLYLIGQPVDVLWCRIPLWSYADKLRKVARYMFDPGVVKLTTVLPSPALRVFTQKAFLPYLYASNTPELARLHDGLREMLSWTEMLSLANEDVIRHMVMSGLSIALKPITGGGGRGTYVLSTGSGNWSYDLGVALKSKIPYVAQAFAPKFEIPGTPFEFDVRAVCLDPKAVHVSQHARVYTVESKRLLSDSPIALLPNKRFAVALGFKCDSCGLKLPEKHAGKTCPKCKKGMVVAD